MLARVLVLKICRRFPEFVLIVFRLSSDRLRAFALVCLAVTSLSMSLIFNPFPAFSSLYLDLFLKFLRLVEKPHYGQDDEEDEHEEGCRRACRRGQEGHEEDVHEKDVYEKDVYEEDVHEEDVHEEEVNAESLFLDIFCRTG